MNVLETLQAINSRFGPSGREKRVAEKIHALAAPYADEVTTDVMGNLIVHKKGSGPKVMFAAHMDSIGFLVTHIEDSGLLRVGAIGGIEPREVLATPVRFANGVLGTLYEDQGLEDQKRRVSHLFVDIGAVDAADARARVQVGDMAVYHTPTYLSGRSVFGPYLDDRICCVAMLMALEQVKESPNDLYFVFTTQEEVGLRGAQTAAFAIDPDYALAVDVTDSDDLPGSKHTGSSKQGGGAAIKVMDASVISHPWMVDRLRELAREGKLRHQLDVMNDGGTDGGAIHKARAGVCTGGVSIPCRYIHAPQESAALSDVEDCAALLAAFAQSQLPPLEQLGG